MLSPLPKLPERKTLAELGVERREFVELLGAKAERLFFTYRFLMTTELNEFLEKMSRAGIENIVEEGDIGFKIILENGDEFILEYPDSMQNLWQSDWKVGQFGPTISPKNQRKILASHLVGIVDGGPLHT
jgi:ferritin-like protein